MSRTTRTVNAVFLLSLAAGIVCPDGSAADPVVPPRVLVLYSQRRELPINQQWERGIREGIEANLGKPVAIDSEYLDFHRVEKSEDRQALLDLVLSKYQAIKPDVVIPVHDAIAGLFVRQNPFPDAAVVFCSILEKTRDQLPLSPKMTGVLYRFDARRTRAVRPPSDPVHAHRDRHQRFGRGGSVSLGADPGGSRAGKGDPVRILDGHPDRQPVRPGVAASAEPCHRIQQLHAGPRRRDRHGAQGRAEADFVGVQRPRLRPL